jgi:hypothetical protein
VGVKFILNDRSILPLRRVPGTELTGYPKEVIMDVKEAVAETIKNLIIPEFTEIKERLVLIETRLDGFEKRFDDMNKRFDDMRADMNKRFEEHFNYNLERFRALELHIANVLEEIRDLRRIFEDKVSKEDFRLLDKRYLELLGEVNILKERVAQQG